MTIETVLTLGRLKEAHALIRVRLAIASSAFDPDWAYVLAAMDARLHDLRDLLSREDPELLRACEQQLHDERQAAPSGATSESTPDLPKAARVH